MAFIEQHQSDAGLAEFVLPLAKAFARLQQITLHVAQAGLKNPDEAGAASADYLRLFALVALAFMWARMVQVAQAKLAAGARRRGRVLRGQDPHRALLHDQAPARERRLVRPDHGGRARR